jgi:anti-anti-sigma regulatory factor
MPFSITATPGKLVLKLEGAITIKHAQDLAARLAESLENDTRAEADTKMLAEANTENLADVNTENLQDIDTCILQLLCSLRRSVSVLSFDNPSEAFIAGVDRCGLRRELLGARECL